MSQRRIDDEPGPVACCAENQASHEILAHPIRFSLFEPVWSRPRSGFFASYSGGTCEDILIRPFGHEGSRQYHALWDGECDGSATTLS
jgi:hypothetical protein